MMNNLLFEFTVDKKKHTITVKREFAAAIPKVWEAWSTAKIIDRWWAPEGWISETKSMDFKVGGMRFYVMKAPEGQEHWGMTTYDHIELHRLFSGRDCFTDKDANIITDHPNSDYSIHFDEKDGNTLIEHITTYPSLEQLEASITYGFKEGMMMAFEGLDKVLSA